MTERQGRRALFASIQPLSGVLRVHPQGGSYRDHAGYGWAASIAFEPQARVRIYGALTAPKPSEWRAIYAELQRWGVRRAVWERHTRRGRRDVTVRIDPMDERGYEQAARAEAQAREEAIERARRIEAEAPRERDGVRYCLGCDDPIDARRLAARPQAVRCLYCQQDEERRRALRAE